MNTCDIIAAKGLVVGRVVVTVGNGSSNCGTIPSSLPLLLLMLCYSSFVFFLIFEVAEKLEERGFEDIELLDASKYMYILTSRASSKDLIEALE
jgi:hypothetical protein